MRSRRTGKIPRRCLGGPSQGGGSGIGRERKTVSLMLLVVLVVLRRRGALRGNNGTRGAYQGLGHWIISGLWRSWLDGKARETRAGSATPDDVEVSCTDPQAKSVCGWIHLCPRSCVFVLVELARSAGMG